jgi:UDP-N-acetylglucosamine--N-acetylmuramyl-(pentapeptide) pyrophosphoryl-undecaprenol N-acetylglucosamine transferase
MKHYRLFCVGGGSGGHVTPILPVIRELKKDINLTVDLVVDKGFYHQAKGLIDQSGLTIRLHTISSGRLRRYAHFKWHDYLRNPKIMWDNFSDIFRTGFGYSQSLWLLKGRPDAVFAKGGFVSLPFGLAAKTLGVPLIIHDSDARPGLTNKVLSRFADRIATGMPSQYYPYDPDITTFTGVPIAPEYRPYDRQEQSELKKSLGFDPDKPLVVATGGGLGANTINQALISAGPELLNNGVQIYHITGKDFFHDAKRKKPDFPEYQMVGFVYSGMSRVLAAADIVVSRASATTIQELAGLAKAAILIPARQLSDQQENARIYQETDSAVVLSDDDIAESDQLIDTIMRLIRHDETRSQMARQLHRFARPQAAGEIARMIWEVMK